MLLFALLPTAWQPYAKAIVAALGLVLSAISVSIPNAPDWVPVVISFMTALGVYGQANGSGTTGDHVA